MDPLIESLKKLVEQSTATLGAEAHATLMLKQQLAALQAQQAQAQKVFWLRPAAPVAKPESDT